jgi:hypothetical protein
VVPTVPGLLCLPNGLPFIVRSAGLGSCDVGGLIVFGDVVGGVFGVAGAVGVVVGGGGGCGRISVDGRVSTRLGAVEADGGVVLDDGVEEDDVVCVVGAGSAGIGAVEAGGEVLDDVVEAGGGVCVAGTGSTGIVAVEARGGEVLGGDVDEGVEVGVCGAGSTVIGAAEADGEVLGAGVVAVAVRQLLQMMVPVCGAVVAQSYEDGVRFGA